MVGKVNTNIAGVCRVSFIRTFATWSLVFADPNIYYYALTDKGSILTLLLIVKLSAAYGRGLNVCRHFSTSMRLLGQMS